jgi:protein-S-isoprenylcysteine O-methyltransferase Ste14
LDNKLIWERKRLRLEALKIPVLALLAITFTLALVATESTLYGIFEGILRGYFPDIYWDPERVQAVTNSVRPIGYICLVVVIALILLGFITKRRHFAFLGSFAFFLPVYGYFMGSMFFLAGFGILRVLWLPLLDLSPALLRLGDIVYLPLWIVTYPLMLQGVQPMSVVINTPVNCVWFAGLLVFCLGALTWLYGKFEKKKVVDFWIYKYSRHPQYLGFILWSYGLMLVMAFETSRRGPPVPSFPWLVSMLIVICVALAEEIKMIKQADEQYLKYRRNTPFMLPLPWYLSKLLPVPNRLLLKKDFPENGREILYTFVIYCTILVLLSILTQQLNLFEGML